MFNNNNPLSLQRELSGVSKGLGRTDVSTVFHGTGASAGKHSINLPAMPMDAQISDDAMRVFRGYHIHEVGHILFTDDDEWREQCNQRMEMQDNSPDDDVFNGKEAISTMNAFEDVFVERKINEAYVGAKKNLESTVESVLAEELDVIKASPRNASELPYVVLQSARKRMGYSTPHLDEYLASVPDELMQIAEDYIDDAIAAQSTKDVGDLAMRLTEDMRARLKSNGYGDKEGEDGNEQGDGEGEESDDTTEDVNQDDDDDDQDDDDPCGGVGKEETTFNLQDLLDKPAEQVAREAAKVCESSDTPEFEMPYEVPDPYDMRERLDDHYSGRAADVLRNHLGNYEASRKGLGKAMRRRSGSLARVLMSQENEYWQGGQSHGRVDRKRMVGIVTGEENIFAQKISTQTQSTSVCVMMDTSGSMNFDKGRSALVALNEALRRSGVPYGILTWSSSDIQIVKSFRAHGNSEVVRGNVGGFGTWQGGTCPVEAILAGYRWFGEQSQAARRIMLFCSDAEFYASEYRRLTRINQMMDGHGYEAYGILIGGDGSRFRAAFPRGVVTTDFKKLADSLLGQLERLLVTGAYNAVA